MEHVWCHNINIHFISSPSVIFHLGGYPAALIGIKARRQKVSSFILLSRGFQVSPASIPPSRGCYSPWSVRSPLAPADILTVREYWNPNRVNWICLAWTQKIFYMLCYPFFFFLQIWMWWLAFSGRMLTPMYKYEYLKLLNNVDIEVKWDTKKLNTIPKSRSSSRPRFCAWTLLYFARISLRLNLSQKYSRREKKREAAS